MMRKLVLIFVLFVLSSTVGTAAPEIVQSVVVNFPVNGRVLVQAREEVGKFPQMLFASERTHEQLLLASIEDKEKWLIPLQGDSGESRPTLKFRIIHSRGFASPVIMSVGLFNGGSDNAFFLTLFSEVGGKIRRLNGKPFFANVQGGYYLGYLNKTFGHGLAVWNFIWDDGKPHYTDHKYQIEIYRLRGGTLKRTFHTVSREHTIRAKARTRCVNWESKLSISEAEYREFGTPLNRTRPTNRWTRAESAGLLSTTWP